MGHAHNSHATRAMGTKEIGTGTRQTDLPMGRWAHSTGLARQVTTAVAENRFWHLKCGQCHNVTEPKHKADDKADEVYICCTGNGHGIIVGCRRSVPLRSVTIVVSHRGVELDLIF